MNIVLCSQEKTEKQNSMEIIAPEEREKRGKIKKSSRSIFVYASTAKVWKLIPQSGCCKLCISNHQPLKFYCSHAF